MRPGTQLMRIPRVDLAKQERTRAQRMWWSGLLGAFAVTLFAATLPATSLLWLAAIGTSGIALASMTWSRRAPDTVFLEDIHDPGIRDTYLALLYARAELESALDAAPGFVASATEMRQQCADAVRLCSRIVTVSNRMYGYLSGNDMWRIAREAALLRTKSKTTRDEVASRAFSQAAAAYDRQVKSCDELMQMRDRIQARLDLVLASLRSFTAAVVRQQTIEDEHFALAGESLTDKVDGVREELAILESAFEGDEKDLAVDEKAA